MSSTDAQAFALSLAKTLMVVIVIFRAGDGSLSVVPADEFDGDASQIVREIDPFARLRRSTHDVPGMPLTGIPACIFSCYAGDRAVVVVEGATVRAVLTETPP